MKIQDDADWLAEDLVVQLHRAWRAPKASELAALTETARALFNIEQGLRIFVRQFGGLGIPEQRIVSRERPSVRLEPETGVAMINLRLICGTAGLDELVAGLSTRDEMTLETDGPPGPVDLIALLLPSLGRRAPMRWRARNALGDFGLWLASS